MYPDRNCEDALWDFVESFDRFNLCFLMQSKCVFKSEAECEFSELG